jgi:DNA (cytosine-5)-methyltransferase 1
MRLLDLFSGAGGAAMGYHRAGFEIVGVDIEPQKHYPFEFHQADAFDYLRDHGKEFDVIHASPPCQAFCDLRHQWNAKKHADLLTPMRNYLKIFAPNMWVIENVVGAPIFDALTLCGTMFNLGTADAELWRHRIFECSVMVPRPGVCNHRSKPACIGVYGGHGRDRRRVITVTGHSGGTRRRDGAQQFTVEQRKEAMGIDWMTGAELSQAIPPAYTEWIGKRLMEAINAH